MKRCSVFILSSLGRFLLPRFPRAFSLNKRWSPRWWISQASGLPDAGAHLSCVVRESHQIGWGVPGTADLLQLRVHTEAVDSPKLLLSEKPWPLFARAKTVKQKKSEREKTNGLVSEPHLVFGSVKKLQQQVRDTLQQHLKWSSYFSTGGWTLDGRTT